MTVECGIALRSPFPAPPGFDFSQSNELDRRTVSDFVRLPDQMKNDLENLKSANRIFLQLVVILGVWVILVQNRRGPRWLLQRLQNRISKTPDRKLRNSRYQPPIDPSHSRVIDGQNTQIVRSSNVLEEPKFSHTLRHRKGGQHVDIWNAAERGNVKEIRNQLASGVQVDAIDSDGNTALTIASRYGRLEAVNTLLSANARVNFKGGIYGRAINTAAAPGHEDIVKTLLNHGEYPYRVTNKRGTSLVARNELSYVVRIYLPLRWSNYPCSAYCLSSRA